jgi:hypothetical protein
MLVGAWLLLAAVMAAQSGSGQRTRLILKSGGYQVVLGYEVVGNVVRYRSAERDGESEDIPLAMVDLPATERWQREHAAAAPGKDAKRPVLSPELAAEEASRRSLTPEVAPGLRLPPEDSVLALDSVQSTPELVPMQQWGTDLNKETAHATREVEMHPEAMAHEIAELKGAASDVQLHSSRPVFYVRVGDDDFAAQGGAMVVDTHGSSGRLTPSGGAVQSGYVVERLDTRRDLRVLNSIRVPLLGTSVIQPDVTELQQETLPGGHWLKLTPAMPLEAGEYVLMEVVSARVINLNVWDFGVNPTAKESFEAIKPEVKKPATLERRPPP